MRRYIIVCFTLVIVFLGIYFVENYTSIVLFPRKEATTFVKIKDKDIYLNDKKFNIRAINLGSFSAGYDDADYSTPYDTYMRWFKLINDMNVNTIRVFNIQSPTFYKAFYDYNRNKTKLYLIQGTDTGDIQKNQVNSYFEGSTYEDIFENIRKMVDVIHGRRVIPKNGEYSSGIYTVDVSKYTLGYIIGTDWNDATIEYTNHMDRKLYNGSYFYSKKGSKSFEIYLASVLDTLVSYESKKYGTQRLVSIGNEPLTDPFEYDEAINDFFNKYTSFDVKNIKSKSSFISGLFASFQVYSGYPDFYGYDNEDSYYTYLKKLNDYYDIPVVISEFGYSTSRLTDLEPLNDDFGDGVYDEVKQGDMTIKAIETMRKAGIDNYILYEWSDEFDKSTWNTMYGVDTTRNQYWNNVLTYSQHFGLLTYDTYTNDDKIIVIDGKTDDWNLSKPVINGKHKMYLSYDKAYINILVDRKNLDDKVYIPIDITPLSGSKKSEIGNLKFSDKVDFIIEINGKNDSKVYVQDYYNPIRALYGKKVYGHDPYEKGNIPKKNSSNFEEIVNLISNQYLVKNNDSYTVENNTAILNTGNLIYGTSNRKSSDYNSLADFYMSDRYIELRIPYGMLNFSDPSRMMIHDDYYKNLGVDFIGTDGLKIGIGNENSSIKMKSYILNGWGNKFEYKERLKKSYYMIKKYMQE